MVRFEDLFDSIDKTLPNVAQILAIKLDALSVIYNEEMKVYSFFCKNDMIYRFTEKELNSFKN
jgi:hypothetical protein